MALYRHTAAFQRAYANLANELDQAGYSAVEIDTLKAEADHYTKARDEVRLASGDYHRPQDVRAGHTPPDRHLYPRVKLAIKLTLQHKSRAEQTGVREDRGNYGGPTSESLADLVDRILELVKNQNAY